MGSDARGRRHPSAPWIQAGKEADPEGPALLRRGRKLVVQIGETFGEGNVPMFVERLDAVVLAERLGLELAPIMIYSDDVSHIVTGENSCFRDKAVLRSVVADVHLIGAIDDAEPDLMLAANQI